MECWATVTVTLFGTEKFPVTQSYPFTVAQDSVLIPGSEPVHHWQTTFFSQEPTRNVGPP